jgi:hypothetical protein
MSEENGSRPIISDPARGLPSLEQARDFLHSRGA